MIGLAAINHCCSKELFLTAGMAVFSVLPPLLWHLPAAGVPARTQGTVSGSGSGGAAQRIPAPGGAGLARGRRSSKKGFFAGGVLTDERAPADYLPVISFVLVMSACAGSVPAPGGIGDAPH